MNSELNEKNIVKKYLPVTPIILLTLILILIFRYNKEKVGNLIEEGKKDLVSFYMDNLYPIFSKSQITTEDIFNFALFNTIPIDKNKDKVLLITEDDKNKTVFEIKTLPFNKNTENYERFIKDLGINKKEKEDIDSILNSYKNDITVSILANDKNTLAINPKLIDLQKVVAADLINYLLKLNRVNLEKIFNHDIRNKINITEFISKIRKRPYKEYIFITPDSIFKKSFVPDTSKLYLSGDIRFPQLGNQHSKEISVELNFDMNEHKLKKLSSIVDSNKIIINIPIELKNIIPDFNENVEVQMKELDIALKKLNEQLNIKIKSHERKEETKKIKEFKFINPVDIINKQSKAFEKTKDWEEFGKKIDSMVKQFENDYSDSINKKFRK